MYIIKPPEQVATADKRGFKKMAENISIDGQLILTDVFISETTVPELFKVTPQGRVIADDIDVTEDDETLAGLFVRFLKRFYGVEVKRRR